MSTMRQWISVQTVAVRERASQLGGLARRSMPDSFESPRSAAALFFGAVVLACGMLLWMLHLVQPMQNLPSSRRMNVPVTLQPGTMQMTAVTSTAGPDMIVTLDVPQRVVLDTKCPWLKDTHTKACHGQRGRKVVGDNLISCGGCASYEFADDKSAAKGGAR